MIPKELEGKIEVRENGEVFSLLSNKLLKLHLSSGYYKIAIYFPDGNKQYKVHRLVASKYIPNPNNLPCVNHKDGNKLNNHKDNLEWCTHQENSQHASTLGLMVQKFGEDNPQSKLTLEDVEYCRRVYIPRDKEFGGSALARRFGVAQQVMSKVLLNQTWREYNV